MKKCKKLCVFLLSRDAAIDTSRGNKILGNSSKGNIVTVTKTRDCPSRPKRLLLYIIIELYSIIPPLCF